MHKLSFGKKDGDSTKKSVIYPIERGMLPAIISFTKWKKLDSMPDEFCKSVSNSHGDMFGKLMFQRLSVIHPDGVPSVRIWMDGNSDSKSGGSANLHLPPRLSFFARILFESGDDLTVDGMQSLSDALRLRSAFHGFVGQLALGDCALNTLPVIEWLSRDHQKLRAGPNPTSQIRISDVSTHTVYDNESDSLGVEIVHELGVLGRRLSDIQILAAAIGNPELAELVKVDSAALRTIREMAERTKESYLNGDIHAGKPFRSETVVVLGTDCHNGALHC